MLSDILLSGYRFLFFYEKDVTAGFQKISNISARVDVEYIHEGGNSGYDYPILSPKKRAGKLTFEKGYGYYNPLVDPHGFAPGKRIINPCTIIVLSESGKIARAFSFDKGLVVSWESSPLDAERGEVMIDKVEIEHTGLFDIRV